MTTLSKVSNPANCIVLTFVPLVYSSHPLPPLDYRIDTNGIVGLHSLSLYIYIYKHAAAIAGGRLRDKWAGQIELPEQKVRPRDRWTLGPDVRFGRRRDSPTSGARAIAALGISKMLAPEKVPGKNVCKKIGLKGIYRTASKFVPQIPQINFDFILR